MKYTRKAKKQRGGLTKLNIEGLALPEGWSLCRSEPYDAICRKLCFKRFLQTEKGPGAMDFWTEFAQFAHEKKHHPEWKNSYNKVEIVFTTHDSGGITELDLECANKVNEILQTKFVDHMSAKPC